MSALDQNTLISQGTSVSSLVEGRRLGRYELLLPIAEGGMASVWLARLTGALGFERIVAVKTILSEFSVNPVYRSMFMDEATIAARIHHPNVAQVLDVGRDESVLYQVLEWVDGDSLAALHRCALRQGKLLSRPCVLRLLADVCSGLHAAHELSEGGEPLGVVHRDVSPQNVLISAEGHVKVIDFGIATGALRQTEKTRAGVVKGKLSYMAPEQAMGMPVDRRADIWSVGIILHLLLRGKLPFTSRPARYPAGRRMVQPGSQLVEAILERALSRSASQRYQTADEMRSDLERALRGLGGLSREALQQELAPFREQLSAKRIVIDDALKLSRERRESDVAPPSETEEEAVTQRVSSRVIEPRSNCPDATCVAGLVAKSEAPDCTRGAPMPRAEVASTAGSVEREQPVFGWQQVALPVSAVVAASSILLLAFSHAATASLANSSVPRAEQPVPSVAAPLKVAPVPSGASLLTETAEPQLAVIEVEPVFLESGEALEDGTTPQKRTTAHAVTAPKKPVRFRAVAGNKPKVPPKPSAPRRAQKKSAPPTAIAAKKREASKPFQAKRPPALVDFYSAFSTRK